MITSRLPSIGTIADHEETYWGGLAPRYVQADEVGRTPLVLQGSLISSIFF